MKMRNKGYALLAAFALAAAMLAVTACSPGKGGYTAVFYYTYGDTYIASVRAALDKALADGGVKYKNYDANSSQTAQDGQIDEAVGDGANMLIVNIVDAGSAEAAQKLVDKAKAAKIPIVFFNRALGVDGEDVPVLQSYDAAAFVGTDAPEAGHMQGKMIGEYVLANYDKLDLNGDGVISYAMFKGQEGNAEAIARTQYGAEDANKVLTAAGKPALAYFNPSGGDNYQVDLDGNWSDTAADKYMSANLAEYNEENGNMIELVIANNDGMALGAIAALNEKGYNLGEDSSRCIPVFGVDATDAAKAFIDAGKMTGTIKQDAEGMASCIAFLAGNVSGKKPLMDGTDSYNKDNDCSVKIFIPYGVYDGR